MKDEPLRDAFGKWEELSATHEERLAYEVRLKQVLDAGATVREAELREQEALEKGIEKGRKEGRKEGIEENRKIMARRLLETGMSIKEVAKLTELTMHQLEELS